MKNNFLFIFSVVVMFASCDRGLMNRKASKEDFTIKGLLDSLHLKVLSGNPLLFKVANVDGNSDSTEMKLDSIGWSREFQIFNDLKINPGRLAGRYNKSVNKDTSITIRYLAKDPKSLQLDSFYVAMNQNHELLEIEAFINYSNSLNTTRQKLEMHFQKLNDKTLPVFYKTQGWQKMRLKDTVHFAIKSRLQY